MSLSPYVNGPCQGHGARRLTIPKMDRVWTKNVFFYLLFPGFLRHVFGDVAVQVRLQLETLAADETHEDLTRVDTKQMFPATTAITH